MASQYPNAPNNSIHFFKIILQSCLRDGELRIPRGFMSKYGGNLPNPVFLRLPNGEEWEVNWVKHDGDVFFQKGWKEFAEHYSLAHGHFLVFRYEGKSRFYVHIFDKSALEISYPMVKGSENGNVRDKATEISHEFPPRKRKRERSPMENSHQPDKMRSSLSGKGKSNLKPESGMSKLHVELDGTKVRGNIRRGLFSTEKALEIAQASCSKATNPYFIQIIHKTYFLNNFMIMPIHFSKTNLNRKKGTATLRVSGERSWSVNFYSSNNGTYYLGSGWKIFVEENSLKPGDVCVFEMIQSSEVSFNVAIFHVAERSRSPSLTAQGHGEKQLNKEKPQKDHFLKSESCEENHNSDELQKLPRTSSQVKNHFIVHIKPQHAMVPPNIPIDFGKRFIGREGKYATVQTGERSWTSLKVACYPSHGVARFSKGWSAFVTKCNLKPGDSCQFELIDEQNLVFKFTKL